ncbi:TIGR04283 family arsenosugar biosynthesis glycosyltransferase [Psychroflexus sp. ALD_RP9]|uniref:TIGR04283 family arsenosugar biosynthesis glycosyltransferase n=1 Tax=Psychroflexus sp. ALD_RP9 TaxID=2777186 RepID=UPI001A902480|nr:TIGR04283 family arsenosugar biosynthesis glycosyltransferase [Psychroflexus sp. ALD_RP9]QSS97801.1 TIGR04283 family arsenosugar biosynthesis glycosyltransferase [Psychroflexus sp. ALD_RP9]
MLSLIIPVYNEAKILKKTIEFIKQQLYFSSTEILVVDGQSSDNTWTIIQKLEGIKSIKSEKGRAKQMNTGAKAASQDLLFFLHIDSQPPLHFDKQIINTINNNTQAGSFRLKFNDRHWWLSFICWFTQFNFTVCRGGDQGLFITKNAFEKIGGFNEDYIVFEDHEIVKQLKKHRFTFKVMPDYMITSSRLFRQYGIFRLQVIFAKLYIKRYILKQPPNQLYKSYQKAIQKNWTKN